MVSAYLSSRQHKDGSGGWAADSRRHTPDARMHNAVSCARARVCAHSPRQILDKHRVLIRDERRNEGSFPGSKLKKLKMSGAFPIGTPGEKWGDAERDTWRSSRTIQRSYKTEVVDKLQALDAAIYDVVK